MLGRSAEKQHRLGYFHTIREICQQPSALMRICDLRLGQATNLESLLAGIGNLTLTGSGSSEYAGDCVRLTLQRELAIVTQAIGGGVFQ